MSILTVKRTCTHERLKQDVITLFNCEESDYDLFLKAYFTLMDVKIIYENDKLITYNYKHKNFTPQLN